MTKVIQFFMLVFESVSYTLLLLLFVSCMIYGIDIMHQSGSPIQAQSFCDNNSGQAMTIKRILSVDNQIAKLEMQDGSIHEKFVKHYLRDYKGHVTIRYINLQVGDMVCVNN